MFKGGCGGPANQGAPFGDRPLVVRATEETSGSDAADKKRDADCGKVCVQLLEENVLSPDSGMFLTALLLFIVVLCLKFCFVWGFS